MRHISTMISLLAIGLIALVSVQCNLLSGEEASCSQTENNVVEISGDVKLESCTDLIKTLDIHDILVKPDGTFYEVLGEILIDFDHDYYLRGAGIEDAACLSPVIGQSPFTVRAVYSSCSEKISVDIIEKPQLDAPVQCAFTIATGKNCGEPEKDFISSLFLPSSPPSPARVSAGSESSRNRP